MLVGIFQTLARVLDATDRQRGIDQCVPLRAVQVGSPAGRRWATGVAEALLGPVSTRR